METQTWYQQCPEAVMMPALRHYKLLGLKKNVGAIEVELMPDKLREIDNATS